MKKTRLALNVSVLVSLLSLGCLPAPVFAMACAVFSEHGARIRLPGTGGTVNTPYQAANCNDIEVISGQAEVCFTRADGQASCIPAPKGMLTAPKLGAAATGNERFMATLVRLANDQRRPVTGKVSLNARSIPIEVPGFPYRNVLPQAGPIIISLAGVTPARLDDFQLYDMSVNMNLDMRRVYSSGPVTGSVTIPAARIKPGVDYEWKAIQGGRRLSGAFHAASFREAVQIREQLDRIETDQTTSAFGKNILKANAYAEAGYTLNAQQLMAPGSAAAPRPADTWGRELRTLGCP